MDSKAEIIEYLVKIISDETKIPIAEIKVEDSFFDLGLDSISAVYIMELVENKFEIDLKPLDFWDHPTLATFSQFVASIKS